MGSDTVVPCIFPQPDDDQPRRQTWEDKESSSRAVVRRTILVRVSLAQQMGLELEMATLFGLQVDDVHATEQPDETLLTYVVGLEGMELFERIVELLEQKKTSGAIIDVTVGASAGVEGGEPLLSYRAELVEFTEDEALAIVGASALDPWLDRGANAAAGHGFVLAARDTEQLEEDVAIPAGVTGSRRTGLWIDGSLAGVLSHFQSILGTQRTWRAWPDSDLALVIPHPAYADPLDDPLLAQFVQALALAEVHTLEDLRLAFVDLYEGYLIVRNERGQLETWEMLPDGRGLDLDLTERSPVLNYQGDLYSYGNTYPSREESEQAIRKEREK